MRIVRFRSNTLPLKVEIIICPFDDFVALCERRGWDLGDVPDAEPSGVTHIVNGDDHVVSGHIWLAKFKQTSAFDVGVLTHEALHVVWRQLEALQSYDEEMHCYLLEWVVSTALTRLS